MLAGLRSGRDAWAARSVCITPSDGGSQRLTLVESWTSELSVH